MATLKLKVKAAPVKAATAGIVPEGLTYPYMCNSLTRALKHKGHKPLSPEKFRERSTLIEMREEAKEFKEKQKLLAKAVPVDKNKSPGYPTLFGNRKIVRLEKWRLTFDHDGLYMEGYCGATLHRVKVENYFDKAIRTSNKSFHLRNCVMTTGEVAAAILIDTSTKLILNDFFNVAEIMEGYEV